MAEPRCPDCHVPMLYVDGTVLAPTGGHTFPDYWECPQCEHTANLGDECCDMCAELTLGNELLTSKGIMLCHGCAFPVEDGE